MYELSKQVYLDKYDNQYKTIIVMQPKPSDGSLDKYVRTVSLYKYDSVNPFRDPNLGIDRFGSCGCYYGFRGNIECNGMRLSNGSSNDYVTIEQLPQLLILLNSLGYKIDNSLSKILYQNQNARSRDFIGFLVKSD